MKFQIVFSENSKNDLISIARYISNELLSPEIAEKLLTKMLFAINSLDTFPKRYKLCEYENWKSLGLRILPVDNYLVFYIVDEINNVVKIYRIIYGKRDIERQFTDDIIFE